MVVKKMPAAKICRALEAKLHGSGLNHLTVRLVSAEDADPLKAIIVDPNQHLVLTLEVDRLTGAIREFL